MCAPVPSVGLVGKTGAHAGAHLHEMVKWFKTQTTNEYIKGVKNGLFPSFDKHIWQRNYYEHIITSEQDYEDIWKYIDGNLMKFREKEGNA